MIEDDDSIEDIILKNELMKDKIKIVIETVEDQLAIMGHDMGSFFALFNSQQQSDSRSRGKSSQIAIRDHQGSCISLMHHDRSYQLQNSQVLSDRFGN